MNHTLRNICQSCHIQPITSMRNTFSNLVQKCHVFTPLFTLLLEPHMYVPQLSACKSSGHTRQRLIMRDKEYQPPIFSNEKVQHRLCNCDPVVSAGPSAKFIQH